MPVPRGGRFEYRLVEVHPGLPVRVGESDGDPRFMAGLPVEPIPNVRKDKPTVLHNFMINTAYPMIDPLGRPHAASPCAAWAEIGLAVRDREAGGARTSGADVRPQ